ncbi:hypothetical protein SAMN06295920_11746, partial [Rhizorhabdus histidinilytica]
WIVPPGKPDTAEITRRARAAAKLAA